METNLMGSHRQIYDAVFQHPVARDLAWRDVRAMLGALDGLVQEERDGSVKMKRNGRSLILHRMHGKSIADVGDVMRIRDFLERSKTAVKYPPAEGTHVLVVIDDREARVFWAEFRGSVPKRILPPDPNGLRQHLHKVEDDSTGQRKPEQKRFYQSIAKAMHGARQILVFGSGAGASLAMRQLLAELGTNHNYLAERIVGSIAVNEDHLTEHQLLARTRDFYATAAL
jgi:hypothetical protein